MRNTDILTYYNENTNLQLIDLFKFIYQSCFGCEHLVSDYAAVKKRIEDETEKAKLDDLPVIEPLDGEYCRVHLKLLRNADDIENLSRCFIDSSEETGSNERKRFATELAKLVNLSQNGELPFEADEVTATIEKWRRDDFMAVHHSSEYKDAHHPAYRVIKKEYCSRLNLQTDVISKV